MSGILDKPLVLKLNRSWLRIGWCTVREAVTALAGSIPGGTPPLMAMSIELDENGELVESVPVTWDEWIKLPVRENDLAIGVKDGSVRCPTVIIAGNYDKIRFRKQNFTPDAIRRRDRNICQVSKRVLGPGEGNLGHIVARAKGGARSWDNIVWMDRKLNTLQGTNLPEEMGWGRLEPKEPLPLPEAAVINEVRHPHHKPFVK